MTKLLPLLMLVVLAACTAAEAPESAETPLETPTSLPDETPTSLPVETPIPTPKPVEILRSIPYADIHALQKLDVYIPTTGDGPFPTILAIHGGAFRARSKAMYGRIGRYFAERGYAFVPINYRLLPNYRYPAQVEDSFCALAWLHENHEEYGFDPSRVVVLGGSAGGYLTSMLATADNPDIFLQSCPHEYPDQAAVRAAVVFYGFYDFVDLEDYPAGEVGRFADFWGAEHEELSLEQLEEMSPIKQIDGSEPPIILLHGTADNVIPSVMSERFADALSQAGVDVELVLMPDVGHAFELKPLDGEELTVAIGEIEAFLDEALLP